MDPHFVGHYLQGLETLRSRLAQQAEEMESTKEELKKANTRAKQVEPASLAGHNVALSALNLSHILIATTIPVP